MSNIKYLDLYYAAYGSNMNLEEMKNVVLMLSMKEQEPLKDMNFYFVVKQEEHIWMFDLTLQKVNVCLFKISENDLKSLDEYEEYPKLYGRSKCDVFMDDGSIKQAFFYEMDPSYEISTPSESYYRRVEQGFRDNDLDTRFLEEAYAKCKR